MARLISQSGKMQRAAPFVLPRTAYYSRSPYGMLVPMGANLRGLGQDAETISAEQGGASVFLPGESGGMPTGSGINWGNLFTSLATGATKAYSSYLQSDLQSQLLNRGLLMSSSGQLVPAIAGTNLSQLAGSLGGMMPLLLVGGGVLLLVMLAKK